MWPVCVHDERHGTRSPASRGHPLLPWSPLRWQEVAAPYFEFIEAGFDVTIASIQGGEIPFDEGSLNP